MTSRVRYFCCAIAVMVIVAVLLLIVTDAATDYRLFEDGSYSIRLHGCIPFTYCGD